jgi:hypothetical protein
MPRKRSVFGSNCGSVHGTAHDAIVHRRILERWWRFERSRRLGMLRRLFGTGRLDRSAH